MLSKSESEAEKMHIRKNQLYGIELRPDMFTVATTNMILRGDGKSNLHCDDFLVKNPKQLQTDFRATVGMLNPPYSQGTKKDPSLYEIAFTEHLLDSLLPNSRCAVIVPQSSMTGKSKEEQQIKESILKKHTLEGTIMLQKDTFYGIGVIPCIAVFTAGVPHDKEKVCKFVNFEDDGFKVAPHIGLLETESAKDKKQHLLDVWFDRIESPTKFCVKTTITAEDEWLHSFYYFNDEIPTDKDFEKTVGDYLTFEFSMIMQGRKYLFEQNDDSDVKKNFKCELNSREWREERLTNIFEISPGKRLTAAEMRFGYRPFIGATDSNNGITNFVSNENISLDKNVLGVNYNGSVVENFYHPYECIFSDDVKRFHLKNREDNKFSLLFMKTNIFQQKSKFLYAYKFNEKRMKAQNIMLPVTSTGQIDYDFMEEYIKELEAQKLEEYREFATKRLNECKKNSQSVEQLDEKEWKPFFIKDLFQEVQRGKRLIKENQKSGFVPYISSSAMNNGVDNFISNDVDVRRFENCLSLANSGSVGSCFYEPFEFVASDHITHLKNKERNKFQYLFEATLLNRLSEKYNFNREINDVRISKEIILLPVDYAGNPDYSYMENFIKNLMVQKYTEYLEFKNKTHIEYKVDSAYGL